MANTVLVTGGSRGIGKAISKRFAKEGYNVIINYNNSEEKAKKLEENLLKEGYNVCLFKADVSNRQSVEKMIKYCIDEFKHIDILINNAGISDEKLFTDITDNDWDKMMDVNLKSCFYTSQEALKYMLPRKRGNIINISSMWGITGASCEVHYSVSKAGLIGLTKALAKELGPSNIRVNAIAPGVIQTDMMSDYDEDTIRQLKYETPLMRIGTCEDVANVAYFLGNEQSNFITGQIISTNGGFVI